MSKKRGVYELKKNELGPGPGPANDWTGRGGPGPGPEKMPRTSDSLGAVNPLRFEGI